MPSPRLIGITLGDVAGIGPEVTLKALASGKISRRFHYVIIGDSAIVDFTARRLKIGGRVEVWQSGATMEKIRLGEPNHAAARAAHGWIIAGARLCMEGKLAALVTAPVNKETISSAGISFIGATELLAKTTGTKKFAMMLHSPRLKVSPATGHIGLRQVCSQLTADRIVEVAELTAITLQRLGKKQPRIAIAAVNPHAGDGGLFGDEEARIVAPAVKRARRSGLNVTGPEPGDTIFYRAYHGEFDAVVPMFHDQGLAPFKVVAFDVGVNLTMGLPIVRTSPDHGTAYTIAGKNKARPDSMIASINLAARLANRHS